uniref:Uncharacterized protein n=1 Tax=viral metagenome TaxID=1070528 RepID=A0A6M3M493_9ZZZZ
MAQTVEFKITVEKALAQRVENVYGGTIAEHVQAVVNRAVADWTAEAGVERARQLAARYERLDAQKKKMVDDLLATVVDEVVPD